MVAQHLPHKRLDPGFKLFDEVGAPGVRRVIISIETQPFEPG